MAELLYRLGNHAARHARGVLVGWLVLLIVAAGAFVAFRGTLTTTFSIPGTPTEEVTDRLAEVVPDAAGGTGTVVLATEDRSAFTDEQRATVADAVARAAEVDGVADVIDPFVTEAEREARVAELTEGRVELHAARAELERGRARIEKGRADLEERRAALEAGRARLEEARARAEAAGRLAVVGPRLDADEAELEAGAAALDAAQAELEAGAAELEAGEAELEAQEAVLADAEVLLDAADGVRVVSADRETALVTVVFTEPLLDVSETTREGVMAAFADLGDGIVVEFGADLASGVPEVLGVSEVVGLVIAAVVLLVMLGTLVGAGLPLLTALVGVGVAALVSLAFSGVVEMASLTPVLGLMLGLAVGIDYSLFIVNRHRHQLRAGYTVRESVGLATGTSGNAVVFAGATVLIALLALNMTGIPFLGLMGTVAALFIAIAVAVAITLTPALLTLVGERILSRRERAALAEGAAPTDGASAAAAPVTRTVKPLSTGGAVARVVAGVVGLLVLAIPALDLRIGLPDGSAEATESTQYRAFSTIAHRFGAGANGPLLVVADLPPTDTAEEAVSLQADIAQTLLGYDDVVAVAPVALAEDRSLTAFQVVPRGGPNAESTADLVHELRAASPLPGGIEIGVAGQASGAIDISDRLDAALPGYLAVVVGLSLVILVVVFRSLLVPLVATGGFILSFFAALGGVVAVYQWGMFGWLLDVDNPGPVLSFLPTLLVGILFGLAMDYMLFIGSGIREAYAHGASPRDAVVQGLRAGRSVVTAAAIIMASVFGGFVFADSTMIRPIGFALALGVLLDAFVVRMLVVPGFLHLVGSGAWWLPRWLDRLLPDVDVEGSALERRHPHAATPTTPDPTPTPTA